MSPKARPGPRERLLAAAQHLFYTRGASVGVDALLKEAKVARRSLYEHFGDKDGLVAAVLRRASEEDVAWYVGRVWPVRRSPEPGFLVCSIGLTNSCPTRASGVVGTSRPTLPLPTPAIQHMRRPRLTGDAFAHSSFGNSRNWAMPAQSRLPSVCTC